MWRNHFECNLKSKDLFLFAENLNLEFRRQLTSPSLPPVYECFFLRCPDDAWRPLAGYFTRLYRIFTIVTVLGFHSRTEIIIQFGMYFLKKPSHRIGVWLKVMPNVQFLKVISRKRWGSFCRDFALVLESKALEKHSSGQNTKQRLNGNQGLCCS